MLAGDRRALSRLLTLVERDPSTLPPVMAAVHPRTGRAHVVGVTGPPGAGKSTIIDGLVSECRSMGMTAGVVAVDPTSAFTGGAVLGDRIRMSGHHADDGVYVRSLSTRGAQGGLSRAARASVRLLDAFGIDRVFVESVGVGQTELDVATASDSVAVVLVPEAGDSVQVMKAGLMEIGDVYAVNKADRGGADRLAAAVKAEVRSEARTRSWSPPVLMTRAQSGEGIPELLDAVERHAAHLRSGAGLAERRAARRCAELADAVSAILDHALSGLDPRSLLGDVADSVASGEVDPYSAAAAALSTEAAAARVSDAMRRAAVDRRA